MTARRQTLLLFLLALLVLGPGIWEPTGLTGKDEFYLGLRTPMEMMAGDHWLVPFLDGVPRIRKPPLLYWLGRMSYETFGVSLISARAVALLFAALLVMATAGIARRLSGDKRIGLMAGLILLSCLGLHSEGRRFMLDVPVAALSSAAFWCLLAWLEKRAFLTDRPVPRERNRAQKIFRFNPLEAEGRRRSWPWLTGTTLLLAAGFLVKGPIVALVCGAGVLGLLASRRLAPQSLLSAWRPLAAHGALFLALALPWFFVVRALYPEAAQLAFADELESRQFFHLSPEITLGFVNVALPWVFVFFAAAWAQRRAAGLPRLLLVWFLASFLPFFFIRSFDRYLIGSLVPAAIFLAWALPGITPRWPFRLGLAIALVIGGGLAAFALWFGLGGWYWLIGPALYFSWAWRAPENMPEPSLAMARRSNSHALLQRGTEAREGRNSLHLVAAPALFWLALLGGVFPALGVNAVPPAVVELGRTRPIALFDGPQPALLPILSQRPLRHYARLEPQDAAQLHADGALIFAESGEVPRLQSQLAQAGYKALPAGHYRALASHGSGLRFARVGASAQDWREAFASRRLDPLFTTIEWFEVQPR